MNRTQRPETQAFDLSPKMSGQPGTAGTVTCPPRPPLSIGGQGQDTAGQSPRDHSECPSRPPHGHGNLLGASSEHYRRPSVARQALISSLRSSRGPAAPKLSDVISGSRALSVDQCPSCGGTGDQVDTETGEWITPRRNCIRCGGTGIVVGGTAGPERCAGVSQAVSRGRMPHLAGRGTEHRRRLRALGTGDDQSPLTLAGQRFGVAR